MSRQTRGTTRESQGPGEQTAVPKGNIGDCVRWKMGEDIRRIAGPRRSGGRAHDVPGVKHLYGRASVLSPASSRTNPGENRPRKDRKRVSLPWQSAQSVPGGGGQAEARQ